MTGPRKGYAATTGVTSGAISTDLTLAVASLNFRMHLVQSLTFLAVPPTIILAACKFGLKIFLVLFLAWETLCPYITPLPQLKHIAAIDNFLG